MLRDMERGSRIDRRKWIIYTFFMELEYTYWKSKDGWFVGYLNIWPDHLTQGKDVRELEEMLRDLYKFYKEEQAEIEEVEKKTGQLKVPA